MEKKYFRISLEHFRISLEHFTHRDFGSRFFPATISPFLLATLVSKEVKYFKELKFLDLVRYFSSWIEKLLKTVKVHKNQHFFSGFSKFIQF